MRRLIERVGFRRHRLFAASPEAAERLRQPLAPRRAGRRLDAARAATARPATSSATWSRSPRPVELVGDDPPSRRPPDAVLIAEPEQVKGLEFDHVYLLGLARGALAGAPSEADWIPDELLDGRRAAPGADVPDALRAPRAYVAMTRARGALVLSRPEAIARRGDAALAVLRGRSRARSAARRRSTRRSCSGPAEGLHATYRMLRDEVLEASWRAGRGALARCASTPPRTSTARSPATSSCSSWRR